MPLGQYKNSNDVESISTLTGRHTPSLRWLNDVKNVSTLTWRNAPSQRLHEEDQLKAPDIMILLESLTEEPTHHAPNFEVEELIGLEPPRLLSNDPVTGNTKDKHCLENKLKKQQQLDEQHDVSYWSKFEGTFSIPTPQ